MQIYTDRSAKLAVSLEPALGSLSRDLGSLGCVVLQLSNTCDLKSKYR